MNAYQQRVNAERLERQAEPVKKAAKEILAELKSIDLYLHWAMDPDEKDGGAYYTQTLLDHAHELLDLAHAYRQALKANPSPKEEDEDQACA
jgi:hypothetical protein